MARFGRLAFFDSIHKIKTKNEICKVFCIYLSSYVFDYWEFMVENPSRLCQPHEPGAVGQGWMAKGMRDQMGYSNYNSLR